MRSNVNSVRLGRRSDIIPYAKTVLASSWQALMVSLFLFAAFTFTYAEVLGSLVHHWSSVQMYSYGFLIPWISLYLVWARRQELREIQPVPNYVSGLVVLALGLFMLVIGRAGAVLALQELSLIVSITGIVLLLMGKRFLRALWVPIAYLLFMIPVWEIITDRLHLPFQIFSANLGVTLLQAVGIPVYQEGIYIYLPNITLEVARVCSGVNYLIAVIAIGIPLAHLFLKGWPRRTLLICSAVIIAILSNGLRVALTGTLSYYGIGGNIHGPFHALQGFFVSVIGYGALFIGLWVLSKFPSRVPPSEWLPSRYNPVSGVTKKRAFAYLGVSVSALLFLVGSYLHFYKPLSIPLKRELNTFPLEIGDWKTIETAADHLVYNGLGLDREFSRTYHKASGEVVQLYIGYYAYQEQGREIISEKTDDFHSNASKIKVSLNSHSAIEINRLIRQEGKRSKLVLFWYDVNGRAVADRWMAKAYTAWDTLSRGRSNSAILILISDFPTEEDLPRIQAASQAFVQKIWPLLRDYLPAD